MSSKVKKYALKPCLGLTIFCFCLISHAVQACQFEDETAPPETFFRKAESAFWGHVTRTEEKTTDSLKFMNQAESFTTHFPKSESGKKSGPPIVEATFEVVEVFKGNPPDDHMVRDLVISPGNCATPLLAGFDYMFFISVKDDGFHYVGLPTGTHVLADGENKQAKEFIQQIRQLKSDK